MEENRPKTCFDPNCKILWSNYNKEAIEEGFSFDCFGKMQHPHLFTAEKCEHVNEYSHCIFTPLKGHIRFFINEDDAWAMYQGCARVMDDHSPWVCKECGPITRRGDTLIVFKKGEEEYCYRCAVRLGKITWHPEEKRYY